MEVVNGKVVIDHSGLVAEVGRMDAGKRSDAVNLLYQIIRARPDDVVNVDAACERLRSAVVRDDSVHQTLADMRKLITDNMSRTDMSLLSQKVTEMQLLLERQGKTVNEKGKEGEQTVFDILSESLYASDGYTLEDVSGLSGHCDIRVKRTGYGDVHIDVKNHSRKVGQRDVDKFVNDLNALDCSGIMVAMNEGIVGKRHFEVNQLSTGKFAMYVSKTVDVGEYVRLIHTLESICCVDGKVRVSSDTLRVIEAICEDTKRQFAKLTASIKSSLSIASNISLDRIIDVVRSNHVDAPTKFDLVMKDDDEVVVGEVFECAKCSKKCKSKTALLSHSKKCSNS